MFGCKSVDSHDTATHGDSVQASGSGETVPRTEPKLEEGRLIAEFGKVQIGNTEIDADAGARKITVTHITQSEKAGFKSKSSSAMSPGTWTLEDGWFAFVQKNGELVWLHDGGGGLLLVERKTTPTQNFTNTYGTNSFPVLIPDAVLSRVSEPLRAKIEKQAHGGKHEH